MMNKQASIRKEMRPMKKRHPVLAIAVIGTALAALVYAPPANTESGISAHGLVKLGPAPSGPAPAKPEAPQDALGRNTPRGTVLGFMIAARKGQNDLAVQYLNTPLRDHAAIVLAHELYTVLDRDLPANLARLSNNPEGSLSNALSPTEERVGTIHSDNRDVDIVVERVDRGESGSLWLFSSKTLQSIPELYNAGNPESFEDMLPKFLVKTRIAGIALYHWLAAIVGIPLLYYLTHLLDRLLAQLIGGLRRRLYRRPDLPNPEVLLKPVRLLLLAFLIHWTITSVSLPLAERLVWSSIAAVITIGASVWLLLLLNGWTENYVHRLLTRRNITGIRAMLRLARRACDVLVLFAGLVVTLYYFGANPTAVFAGLGVGGIALALAAQKTLENVIAGISIVFDGVIHVGDTLKVGDVRGAVEDMGMRSTRIRTLDRTVVSIPNSQIANMALENVSARDKFWFHLVLALRYGTTSAEIRAVLERIRSLLQQNHNIESDSIRVHLLRFGRTSLDVEVVAYVPTRDLKQFLDIQQELLLRITEYLESAGVRIARPLQAVLADAGRLQ